MTVGSKCKSRRYLSGNFETKYFKKRINGFFNVLERLSTELNFLSNDVSLDTSQNFQNADIFRKSDQLSYKRVLMKVHSFNFIYLSITVQN